MAILDKILTMTLDKIIRRPKDYERNPTCTQLYWTLPDKIKIGRPERMKPVCDLGLKTKPTCGGFFTGEPHCVKYSHQNTG